MVRTRRTEYLEQQSLVGLTWYVLVGSQRVAGCTLPWARAVGGG